MIIAPSMPVIFDRVLSDNHMEPDSQQALDLESKKKQTNELKES